MLIEYTESTKEENLAPTAIELRKRIAGRRLVAAVENGLVNEDVLFQIRTSNLREKKEHMHVSFGLSMAGVQSRVTVARAEQQLKIESKLKLLERDINRATSLGRARVDTLTDLETRILAMKAQLRKPVNATVSEELRKELQVDNTILITKNFSECPICKRKILNVMFSGHQSQCSGNTSNLTKTILMIENKTEKESTIMEESTFVPGPPRYFKLVSKGCNFIQWGWEPPVSDGGLSVTEYEMKYEGKYQEMDPVLKKWRRGHIEVPSLMTSRWSNLQPICHTGYTIVNMRSDTDYFSWQIRCMNSRGWSPWVSMNDDAVVRTADAEPPSWPLFFECTLVTSSCIHLKWDAPFFDGGQEIVDYIIYYTVIEREISVISREVMVEYDKIFHVGPERTAVLRNLLADSEVVKIRIQSKNKAGLSSNLLKLSHNCKTEKGSRHMALQRQLHMASKIKTNYIDTDFFSGIQQRLPLKDFIADIKEELLESVPTDVELEEARIWSQIIAEIEEKKRIEAEILDRVEKLRRGELDEMKDEDEEILSEDSEDEAVIGKKKAVELKKSFIFTNAQRRRHYEKKIWRVETLIEQFTKEKHELDMNRARLANNMQATQKRQMLLKVERDRLSNYNSEYVSSSVIHGYETQYLLEDFLDKVDEEYAICQTQISTTKLQVMNGEKRKTFIKTKLDELQYLLKERKAAFLQFEQHCHAAFKSFERLKGVGGMENEKLKPHYFGQWILYVKDRKDSRMKVTRSFMGLLTRYMYSAFTKWRTGEFAADSSDSSMFFGIGSKLLQEAKEQRIELQGMLREAIASTNNIKQGMTMVGMTRDNRKELTTAATFKQQEEGLDHGKLGEGELKFLYEADGYVAQGKFDLAYRLYETQIIYLRSHPPLNVKFLAICHGRLGRMFAMMEKFDRSILEFDRQLSLAREIDDKPEESDAYFGIGFGYMKHYKYDDAIRYLDIAQGKMATLGSIPKRLAALKALRECFDRVGKMDSVRMYAERISQIEGETDNKLKLIDKKLTFMKERLVHSAADIELIIQIERTTLKSLKLRNDISKMTDTLKGYEKQRKLYEELMKGIASTLNAIGVELKQAFETDELEMWSKLVQDTPQLVDVEELKTRLEQRKQAELANYDREKAEFDRLNKLIGNIEDDLEEADDNLHLEDGALMTRARHDKPFRCISFCPANAAGNEVTGTATGGVETFVAAEGNNIHVIDHHNGALIMVFVGDSKSRVGQKTGHVGIVTCLVHDGAMVFSGSLDETIISWDMKTFAKVKMFTGTKNK